MNKNRIDIKLEQLKAENRKALVTFITAGDGGYQTTEDAILAMEKNGADIIEIGVPFSDPVAEGPVIQDASVRALQGGTTLVGIFEMVKRLREKTDTPLLFMMYLNTIYRFGTERFFKLCVECGIDGVIVPDMPFEEYDEIVPTADKYGVYSISLVAPTSHKRVEKIAKSAKGFLYCVSSVGVTGTRSRFDTDFNEFFKPVKEFSRVPYFVGFGISNGEQAKAMSGYCDGVIVGSAIVKIVGEGGNVAENVGKFTSELRHAIDA